MLYVTFLKTCSFCSYSSSILVCSIFSILLFFFVSSFHIAFFLASGIFKTLQVSMACHSAAVLCKSEQKKNSYKIIAFKTIIIIYFGGLGGSFLYSLFCCDAHKGRTEEEESFFTKELEVSIEAGFLGRFDSFGSSSLSSYVSSLDSSAKLGGEISFFLGRIASLLLSESALETTAMEEDLFMPDPLTWIAFFLLPTFTAVGDFSSSDESESCSALNADFDFLNDALDKFYNNIKTNGNFLLRESLNYKGKLTSISALFFLLIPLASGRQLAIS